MGDRIQNGAQFELIASRGEFLQLEGNGRYGLTVDSILNAVPSNKDKDVASNQEKIEDNIDETTTQGESLSSTDRVEKVVVVDANVDLAKKLTQVKKARLIGIWVGLDSLEKFESRFKSKIADGSLKIPLDESEESIIRGKIREVVKDIEYGVVSGIFEFTILNDDFDTSLKQLEEAAQYCFR